MNNWDKDICNRIKKEKVLKEIFDNDPMGILDGNFENNKLKQNKMKLIKFDRYRENLTQIDDKIFSYETHVATLDYSGNGRINNGGRCLVQHGWWSRTTQKHVNYVSNHYGLPIVEIDLNKYNELNTTIINNN